MAYIKSNCKYDKLCPIQSYKFSEEILKEAALNFKCTVDLEKANTNYLRRMENLYYKKIKDSHWNNTRILSKKTKQLILEKAVQKINKRLNYYVERQINRENIMKNYSFDDWKYVKLQIIQYFNLTDTLFDHLDDYVCDDIQDDLISNSQLDIYSSGNNENLPQIQQQKNKSLITNFEFTYNLSNDILANVGSQEESEPIVTSHISESLLTIQEVFEELVATPESSQPIGSYSYEFDKNIPGSTQDSEF